MGYYIPLIEVDAITHFNPNTGLANDLCKQKQPHVA